MTSTPGVLGRFDHTVARAPERVAVRDSDAEWTFAELSGLTGRLAHGLRAAGVGPGSRVGVCLPRTRWLVAAFLGIWRAGGALVPLDPQLPRRRLRFMASHAGVEVIIGGVEEFPSARTIGPAALCADAPDAPDAPPTPPMLAGDDRAYVLYTSGSTGRPKGVLGTHSGVNDLLAALENSGCYADAPRTVGWNASMSFDASIQQWIRVCRGDTVVILDEHHRVDSLLLEELLRHHGIDDLDLTPSHWDILREALVATRPRLFMGGEPIPPRMWRELAECGVETLNLYGPTECHVDSTAAWVSGRDPHIGRPLPGTRSYVLDGNLDPVPDGTVGELYLTGGCLAAGYIHEPALTAERFVADPFGGDGARMYRTGDLVRVNSGGDLEFEGRADAQVKVHGYRIELGEIESVVTESAMVARAVADVRKHHALGDQIVVHCVPSGDWDAGRLREHCESLLPSFMIPTELIAVADIPLTVNGKVDRCRLREHRPAAPAAEAVLEGEVQKLIARVWTDVLGEEVADPEADFFALGGHSLVALRVVARLKADLGVSLRTRDVYRHPKLRDLAAYALGQLESS